jgi:hypothetical protein
MLVRIQVNRRLMGDEFAFQDLALAASSILVPAALIASTIAFWGFAAELNWTNEFFISQGFLSHWQIWLASAGVLLGFARLLKGYAEPDKGMAADQ